MMVPYDMIDITNKAQAFSLAEKCTKLTQCQKRQIYTDSKVHKKVLQDWIRDLKYHINQAFRSLNGITTLLLWLCFLLQQSHPSNIFVIVSTIYLVCWHEYSIMPRDYFCFLGIDLSVLGNDIQSVSHHRQ